MIILFFNFTVYKSNKNLAYLGDIIYNKDKEKEIAWCRAIKATTYKELDKNLRIVLSDEERKLFLKEVKKLNSDNFLYDYWKDEDVNELVRESELAHAEEKGFDNASKEFIKNMLKEGLKLSTVSAVSGKTVRQIKDIQKQMKI